MKLRGFVQWQPPSRPGPHALPAAVTPLLCLSSSAPAPSRCRLVMFRPPRPCSTAVVEGGVWDGSDGSVPLSSLWQKEGIRREMVAAAASSRPRVQARRPRAGVQVTDTRRCQQGHGLAAASARHRSHLCGSQDVRQALCGGSQDLVRRPWAKGREKN
jgi:hypothetical protein